MSFKVSYDANEDRMRLSLTVSDGVFTHYWVTRRQWVNLYARLHTLQTLAVHEKVPFDEVKQNDIQEISALSATNKSMQTQGTSKETQDITKDITKDTQDISEPVKLKGFGLYRMTEHVKIIFQTAQNTIADAKSNQSPRLAPMILTVPNNNLVRLKKIIKTKGQQAGWDMGVAIERVLEQLKLHKNKPPINTQFH